MNNLANKELRMNSVEVCELINEFRELEGGRSELTHSDLMKKIRKELEVLKLQGLADEGNFSSVEYVDAKGESRPCFSLSRDDIIQICASESAIVRRKIVQYINQLEKELQQFRLPQTYVEALASLLESEKTKQQQQLQIVEMTPKAVFADAVSSSQTSILVGELAKLLKQNGVDIGANRMFEWLRASGYLIKRRGSDWNMPTQRSMELELFEIKETTIQHNDGHISISKTPKVTGKGQLYFVNQFINDGGLVCM